jgi:hypothetical protein
LFTHGRLQIVLSVLFFKQDPDFFRSFGFSADVVQAKGSAVIAWTLFERFGLSLMPFWMMARNRWKQQQEFQAGKCLFFLDIHMTITDEVDSTTNRCVRNLSRAWSPAGILPREERIQAT